MHADYQDIREAVSVEPQWFDEHAVPRFCTFHPDKVANIYANEAALALIKCQGCGTSFRVAFSEVNLAHVLWDESSKNRIAYVSDLITDGSIHYGDPPNVRCCAAGATMNSVPVEVLEYWIKPFVKLYKPGEAIKDIDEMEWKRDPAFQIPIRRQR